MARYSDCQRAKVTFDAGRVSIDGALPECYASLSVFRGEYDVPPGHVLVLGSRA